MTLRRERLRVCALSTLLIIITLSTQAQTPDDAYLRNCASCHGPQMRGGEAGPALIGEAFQRKWAAAGPDALEQFIRKAMPPAGPGSLSDAEYVGASAHVRRGNGWTV